MCVCVCVCVLCVCVCVCVCVPWISDIQSHLCVVRVSVVLQREGGRERGKSREEGGETGRKSMQAPATVTRHIHVLNTYTCTYTYMYVV